MPGRTTPVVRGRRGRTWVSISAISQVSFGGYTTKNGTMEVTIPQL